MFDGLIGFGDVFKWQGYFRRWAGVSRWCFAG